VRKKGDFKRSHENGQSAKYSRALEMDRCTGETSHESDVKNLELINVSNVPKFKLNSFYLKNRLTNIKE